LAWGLGRGLRWGLPLPRKKIKNERMYVEYNMKDKKTAHATTR